MNYDQVRDYLLSRPEAWEDYPFGPGPAVFKIRDKLFAILFDEGSIARVNLKCDPAEAQMLRDLFEAVKPGYHMNKRHWNTVVLDGSLPRGEIERMIDRSYGLVVRGLRSGERRALELAWGAEVLYR
ncbi:MmcQ/YjbR family DNA-binding protein [Marinobacterium aestuariivivens]|uniref:MmcQ/YjbR family DNA-binding protein n=1 Tax=Marinobacterium aestuariivivens TaxID=1698799 RepID=A0ABW2A8S2_9GAMM